MLLSQNKTHSTLGLSQCHTKQRINLAYPYIEQGQPLTDKR